MESIKRNRGYHPARESLKCSHFEDWHECITPGHMKIGRGCDMSCPTRSFGSSDSEMFTSCYQSSVWLGRALSLVGLTRIACSSGAGAVWLLSSRGRSIRPRLRGRVRDTVVGSLTLWELFSGLGHVIFELRFVL